MTLRPIKKFRVYEEVIDQIREMVNNGDYSPGTRLPTERELAAAFGVGRPAVREALKILDAVGLLEIRPGSGIYVREQQDMGEQQSMVFSLIVGKNDIVSLLELRMVLEVGAARLAAERATGSDISHLKEAYSRLETQVKNEKVGASEDYLFHYAVAMATHNQAIIKVFSAITDLYRQALIQSRAQSLQIPGRPQAILKEHEEILNAICSRNPDQAAHYMQVHLENVERKISGDIEMLSLYIVQ